MDKNTGGEEEVIGETPRFIRTRHIGRQVLASATGLSIATGLTYIGLRMGLDVVGPENDSNNAMYYAGVALPAVTLGTMGVLGGFYGAASISENGK